MKLLKLPLRGQCGVPTLINIEYITKVSPWTNVVADCGKQPAVVYHLSRTSPGEGVIETSATFDDVTMALVTLATDPNTMFIDLTKPTP